MKITMTAIIERQRARFYIHKKQNKFRTVFVYKKPDTFQKTRQFPLRFLIQKGIHLTLRDFHEILKLPFIYTKHDTVRYVKFLKIKKLDTSQKTIQFSI